MKGMKENALQCLHNGGSPGLGYDADRRPIPPEFRSDAFPDAVCTAGNNGDLVVKHTH